MCAPPGKRTKTPPAPIAAPEIQLGVENPTADTRNRKRKGRNQLRVGLNIPGPSQGSGLSIPS